MHTSIAVQDFDRQLNGGLVTKPFTATKGQLEQKDIVNMAAKQC